MIYRHLIDNSLNFEVHNTEENLDIPLRLNLIFQFQMELFPQIVHKSYISNSGSKFHFNSINYLVYFMID